MGEGDPKKIKGAPLTPFTRAFTGKWRNDVDSIMIAENDFSILNNLRPCENGVKGIAGQTPASAKFAYSMDNGFQFNKTHPTESHNFVQVGNTIYKSNNTVSVPALDTYAAFLSVAAGQVVRFSEAPDSCMCIMDGTTNWIWGGFEARCGYFSVYDPAGTFSYDYTDQVANTINDAQNRATLYMPASGDITIYVGSPRPLDGIKLYLGALNVFTAPSSVNVEYWNGSTWVSVSGLVDGTAIGGRTLKQTGTISFTSTVSLAVVSAVEDEIAYFYRVTFTGASPYLTVYYCTLSMPVQPIVDLWDGSPRSCLAFFKYTTTYSDYTTNILKQDYVSSDDTTYAEIGGLTSSQWVYLGFAERMMGLFLGIPDASYVNTVAAVMMIEYWNGARWVDVGTVVDGSASGGASVHQAGTVTWDPPSLEKEFRNSIANTTKLYYYRVHWSDTLSADVRIDQVTGIPAQVDVKAHRFSLFWLNRLILGDEESEYPNSILFSVTNSNIFNGTDSARMEFEGADKTVAGETIFTRFGGTIYDNAIIYKAGSVHLVDGTDPSNFVQHTVSDSVGCVAPLTLKKCDVSYELSPGLTKHVLIWQSSDGIEVFDGNTVTRISTDIQGFFDPENSDYINRSIASTFTARYDSVYQIYYWQFATGSSTTLNREVGFDIRRKKWFNVVRGANKTLTCGWPVLDSKGNRYNFGGAQDGTLEWLDYGTTFDGNPKVHWWRFGDSPIVNNNMMVTRIRHLKHTAVCKSDPALFYFNHYSDTNAVADLSISSDQARAGYRVYNTKGSGSWMAVYHGLEGIVSTTTEQVGYEPIAIGGLFEVVRGDYVGE